MNTIYGDDREALIGIYIGQHIRMTNRKNEDRKPCGILQTNCKNIYPAYAKILDDYVSLNYKQFYVITNDKGTCDAKMYINSYTSERFGNIAQNLKQYRLTDIQSLLAEFNSDPDHKFSIKSESTTGWKKELLDYLVTVDLAVNNIESYAISNDEPHWLCYVICPETKFLLNAYVAFRNESFNSVSTEPAVKKYRRGRGYSLPELERAGLDKPKAAKLAVRIDPRRKNWHEVNVERLKERTRTAKAVK